MTIISHNYLADHTGFLLKYANNYLGQTKLVCKRAAHFVLKTMFSIIIASNILIDLPGILGFRYRFSGSLRFEGLTRGSTSGLVKLLNTCAAGQVIQLSLSDLAQGNKPEQLEKKTFM